MDLIDVSGSLQHTGIMVFYDFFFLDKPHCKLSGPAGLSGLMDSVTARGLGTYDF